MRAVVRRQERGVRSVSGCVADPGGLEPRRGAQGGGRQKAAMGQCVVGSESWEMKGWEKGEDGLVYMIAGVALGVPRRWRDKASNRTVLREDEHTARALGGRCSQKNSQPLNRRRTPGGNQP